MANNQNNPTLAKRPKTVSLTKSIDGYAKRKNVSVRRAESKVHFNLATMVALAETAGVPLNLLLNEALEDFIDYPGRWLAWDLDISSKHWGEVLSTPEVQERCSEALRALNSGVEEIEQMPPSDIRRAISYLDPDND